MQWQLELAEEALLSCAPVLARHDQKRDEGIFSAGIITPTKRQLQGVGPKHLPASNTEHMYGVQRIGLIGK